MVNAPNESVSPPPARYYTKYTKQSTRRCPQANEGMWGLEAERVRALQALSSLGTKKKISAEKRQEMHFLNTEEREKQIEDYLERETAVATKQVHNAETAIMQELKDLTTAQRAVGRTWKPATGYDEMLNAIWDSLSNLASSDDELDEEDEEDDEEDTELGKLSDDDEPGWVIGTIS